jgi:hypothetical protein
MVQAKGLTDTAVADITLNNDSEEDFGSENNNELRESESEYESQSDSDAEDKLPMHSADETAAWRKQKLEKLNWNSLCSSQDKPTKKPFHGAPGINRKGRGCYQRTWGQYMFSICSWRLFCLHLVAQVNKYTVSSTVEIDSGSSNSGMESKWFDTITDELRAFIS